MGTVYPAKQLRSIHLLKIIFAEELRLPRVRELEDVRHAHQRRDRLSIHLGGEERPLPRGLARGVIQRGMPGARGDFNPPDLSRRQHFHA